MNGFERDILPALSGINAKNKDVINNWIAYLDNWNLDTFLELPKENLQWTEENTTFSQKWCKYNKKWHLYCLLRFPQII